MSEYMLSKLLDDRLEILMRDLKQFTPKKSKKDPNLDGKITEAYFNNAIKDFLPKNIEITNGWLTDEKEIKCHERDIIIFDTNKAPAFLFSAGYGIIPLCSVLYDIQIKKSLGKKTLIEELEKFVKGKHINGIFSISGENLFKDYIETYSSAFSDPIIKILSSEEDGLYQFVKTEKKYSDFLTEKDFVNLIAKDFIKDNPQVANKRIMIRVLDMKKRLDNMRITYCEWKKYTCQSNMKGFATLLLQSLYNEEVSKYLTEKPLKPITVTRAIFDNENKMIMDRPYIDLENDLMPTELKFSLDSENNLDGKGKVIKIIVTPNTKK